MASVDKPDIMLLVIDSLRPDHLGCYGYERETSPFIDSLAEKGVKFEKCYANSFWSVPSHASIFTGDLVSDHKIISNENPELERENLLVNSLKEKGYHTYGNSNNMWVNDLYGYDEAFDDFDFQLWASDMGNRDSNEMLKEIHRGDWDSRKEKYLSAMKKAAKKGPGTVLKLAGFKFERKFGKRWGISDYGSTKSIRRIKRKGKQVEKPLFAFCNFMEVHAAYSPPIGFSRKFSSYYRPKDGVVNAREKAKGENLQKRINLYDDCIRYIDKQLKDFITEYRGENPETVFIITSDHGELFFDNSLEHEEPAQGHDTPSCSDEMLKVPFIIYSEETNLDGLFEPEDITTLREIQKMIESLLDREPFEAKGYAIAENIDDEEKSCKMITDGKNRAVIDEDGEHLYGDEEITQSLLGKLKKETKTLQKLESITYHKEIEEVDI
ncbi:MAG: sulfatase-like hydrolase/transferase [Candidatus Nanohalobium sp.]